MAEIHVSTVPSTSIIFHQPGQHPLPVGAGQPVVVTGKTQDKTATVSGQVANTSVIIRNPA